MSVNSFQLSKPKVRILPGQVGSSVVGKLQFEGWFWWSKPPADPYKGAYVPTLSRLEKGPDPAKNPTLMFLTEPEDPVTHRGSLLRAVVQYGKRFNLQNCHSGLYQDLISFLAEPPSHFFSDKTKNLRGILQQFEQKGLLIFSRGGSAKDCINCQKPEITPQGEEALNVFETWLKRKK